MSPPIFFPNTSGSPYTSNKSSCNWNATPICIPKLYRFSASSAVAPARIAPILRLPASNTAVFKRIISMYSSSVTSQRDSNSISSCCPSQISSVVRLNKSITSFRCSGGQPVIYRNARINIASPESTAVLSFQTLCTVGFPLRTSERSIKSSCNKV